GGGVHAQLRVPVGVVLCGEESAAGGVPAEDRAAEPADLKVWGGRGSGAAAGLGRQRVWGGSGSGAAAGLGRQRVWGGRWRETLPRGRRKYECAGAVAPAPDPGHPLARSPVLRFARTHGGSGAASCSASPREGSLSSVHPRLLAD